MPTNSPIPTSDQPALAPLCPHCGYGVVNITTRVDVSYQVVVDRSHRELQVIDELLGEGGWDEDARADCEACGWHGEVTALRRADA